MAITKIPAAGFSDAVNFRNIIINGDMSIAQRGTSFTGSEYTLDRWRQSLSGGTATVTQETFSVGSEIALCKNYLRQDVSTGDNYLGLMQRVESVRSVKSGGSVTFSFYAKGTNPAGNGLNFHVEQRFGTGGSPSSNVVVYDSDTDIVLTSDWTRYTITFTFTDYTGKTFGTNNDDYIQIEIRQKGSDTSTNAWTLDLTGVQLEAGEVASDFEFLPRQITESLCFRYFYIVRGATSGTGFALISSGTNINGGATGRINMILPEPMRSNPTISSTGTIYFTGSTQRTITSLATVVYLGGDNGRLMFDNTLSGTQTEGTGGAVFMDNETTAFMQFSAEL